MSVTSLGSSLCTSKLFKESCGINKVCFIDWNDWLTLLFQTIVLFLPPPDPPALLKRRQALPTLFLSLAVLTGPPEQFLLEWVPGLGY